ncbi:chemotaxis protein CheY [bacterium BMS3Bbin07]|nr:chemotaxis protein CheY [bacterium BMS3Bbin07]HDH01902.1 response regulator [Nitrospirota bacterium]
MKQARILIIDDEKLLRWSLQQNLEKEGCSVITAEKGIEGLNLYKEERPDITLLDIHLPDISGMTVLERIKEIDRDAIVVMIVPYGDIQTAVKSVRMGAYDFVEKPFNMDKLNILIKKAFETVVLRKEVSRLRGKLSLQNGFEGFDCIVGRSGSGELEINIPVGGVDIEKIEKKLLKRVLEMTGGDEVRAARLLNITGDKLKYRMQEGGLFDGGES